MHPKSPKWLEDIATSGGRIAEWTASVTLAAYEGDDLLRAAVERNFEIIGEALLRLERVDPETAARITDHRKIIGFRNRLAHGYDDTDHQQVWEAVHHFLPVLKAEVDQLLHEADEDQAAGEADI